MHKFKSYRESIDIDYYVYFTKAYFAFNAYLKAKYPTLTDADKILGKSHRIYLIFGVIYA
jgi:hypothetical protein